jgi:hypothetical protein
MGNLWRWRNEKREARRRAFQRWRPEAGISPGPALEPAKHRAFTRQPITDFEESAPIARLDFKYRAVVTVACPLNGRVGYIEAGGRPAYICRF